MFGVVIKLSDGILGLTLLAWGNSIGGMYGPIKKYHMALVSVKTCNVPNVGHIQTGLGMMCIVTMVT